VILGSVSREVSLASVANFIAGDRWSRVTDRPGMEFLVSIGMTVADAAERAQLLALCLPYVRADRPRAPRVLRQVQTQAQARR